MNQRNIQRRTPNAEHRMATRILAHFGVPSSMLDVRCFPSAQGLSAAHSRPSRKVCASLMNAWPLGAPGSETTTEFGAAWKKTARETEREYLSVKLDDPSFPAPIYASLVKVEGDEGFTLIWSRRNGD